MEKFKEFLGKEELGRRIAEMAKTIDADYLGKEVTVICVLKGAIFFATDLLRNMKSDVKLEFVRISSYAGTETTGTVNLNIGLDTNLEGKDVLIVEDIIDTGYSLKFLVDYLNSKNPRSLKIAVLLDKKEKRKANIDVDYVGFEIPNKFVVGYGFDIDEKYRNIPYIGYIEN